MQRKNNILLFLLFLGITIISCKKFGDNTQHIIQIEESVIRGIAKAWDNANNENKIAYKDRAHDFYMSLDYSQAFIAERPNKPDLYVIKINRQSVKGENWYLSISKSNKGYQTEGIFTTRDIENITTLLTKKRVPRGTLVTQYLIDGSPNMAWETTASGQSKEKKIKKYIKQVETTNAAKNKVNSTEKAVNVLPPDEQPCIDWYWTVWDVDTGEILSEEYLYSTGNCVEPPSGPAPEPMNPGCAISPEDADAIINDIIAYGNGTGTVTGTVGPETTNSTTGITKRTMSLQLEFYSTTIPGSSGPVHYYAYFSGIHKRNPGEPWKWEYLNYVSSGSGGELPPCIETDWTFSPTLLIAGDSTSYYLSYNHLINFRVSCFGWGKKLASASGSSSNLNFNAAKTQYE
ncbi:hypothetical protein [Sediminibacterium ginsengisoli]|uniref:Uncharacterized protein n=1 Tax=Sediminibacterium ginsengisoli TaxID=413434 RepID=A0A1T4RHF7_9BACT|nr:hypothetical protein [Sediminibacterium ginsengisoli]SKA15349.1 hypothetical protein SAMN04488132_11278 [Sediminibacterium ginsengisoli]